MASIYKRFGAWVTGLRSNLFTWARIKLTATYVLIIVIILAVFSLILYVNLVDHLRHDLDKRTEYTVSNSEENPLEDAIERLQTSIITADIVVLLVTGSLSYWLAGYTLKPIRKALDAQTRFSAEASHELRTPLAVMRTGTEVLLRGNHGLEDEARKVLESNLEEINLMSDMTEQLLELSRGKSTKPEKIDKLNLMDLVQNTIGKLNKLAGKKHIQLNSGNSADVFVNGKKDDLERMLKNIIANSITHTPEGGLITVSVFNKQGFAEISVIDSGIGIAEKDLPHIFEAFYKADQSRTTVDNQSGAGLGLAIVKQIVEQHHGTIEIKSLVNKGTTVLIRIPTA
jgi:two-component system phosphate regulon sensor histidine kinase PhoR